jgi:uncharacterized protein (DUF1697 family)
MRTTNIFIALLRGINVGGHSIIKMTDLKKLFESLGFTNVITYIQTGNVIFSSNEPNKEKLASQIEKKFKSATGHESKIFILTNDKLKKAASYNPFEPEKRDKIQKCHLMFLSGKPNSAHSKALINLKGEEYQFHIHDDVLYYAYPNKFAGNRRFIDFERVLCVKGTSRSWKVVDKLIELSSRK